jgi:hypothetical protein
VQKIRKYFRKRISDPWRWNAPNPLDQLEKELNEHLREITKLVEEYSLDQSNVTDFRNDMLNALFKEAGSRKDHAWQARFAKKYGI